MRASHRLPNGHRHHLLSHSSPHPAPPIPSRQLGWTDAIRLDSTTLKAGATKAVNVSLPTQSAPSSGVPQVLRVVPNWYASTSSLRIWASYRTREGGDDDMGTTLTGKVHIYTGSINGPDDWVITNWEATLARELERWAAMWHTGAGWRVASSACVPSNSARPPEQRGLGAKPACVQQPPTGPILSPPLAPPPTTLTCSVGGAAWKHAASGLQIQFIGLTGKTALVRVRR